MCKIESTSTANKNKGFGTHMGGCQNDRPFLGTLIIRCRIIIRIQKGPIILTTTQIDYQLEVVEIAATAHTATCMPKCLRA